MLENLHKETYSAYSFRIVHFQLESKLKLPIKKGRGHGGARGVQTCQKISYKWLCPLFLVILKFFFFSRNFSFKGACQLLWNNQWFVLCIDGKAVQILLSYLFWKVNVGLNRV